MKIVFRRSPLAGAVVATCWVLAACSTPSSPTTGGAPTSAAGAPPTAPAASASAAPAGSPVAGGAGSSPAAPPTGSPIKVGVLDDVTGVSAIEGALMRISTDVVVQRTNQSGGINGHPLQIQYVDPQGDATNATNLATQLAQQDNVDVLAGGINSPECLGVEGLAEQLQLVYTSMNGCASDVFTSQQCNKYSFRVYPAGRQTSDPNVSYEIQNFGSQWGILYPDYALGQSVRNTTEAAVTRNGGTLSLQIAVPFGEPNVTPYVTRVPTDGSIQVLDVAETGTDLARVMSVVQQFGINQRTTIVTALGKESFGGVYPDALNGAVISGARPSDGIPGNADDAAFMQDWIAMAKGPDAGVTGPLGGVDHLTPGNGNGYNAYMSMTALVAAMRAANFTGKVDTEKLVDAFANLKIQQGHDFPDGDLIMNPMDHQGKVTEYLLRINGQSENVLQTFPAASLPDIGSCNVNG